MAIHDNFDRAQEFENRDERDLPLQMTLEDLPDLCFSDDEDDEDDEASHHSSDDIGENSDDEEFLADIDNFIGLRKPIFDRCFAFIQKGMPVTMLDVYEIVQEEKKVKSDLRSTQEELDQAQQALKLAQQQFAFKEVEFAQLVAKRAEQSIEQRDRDLLFVERNMALEELRFKNRQLDMQLSSAPTGGAGAASGFGSGSIQMISMTSEEAFVVHGAFDWAKWVKLMVDIKEWPRRWDDQRIQRQFTEKVKKEVIASLQHIRSSSTQKPLPSRLKGFDAEIEEKYYFFTLPAAPSTFADTIEAYLRANDRDKDGKKIPVSVGQTVITDSFARYLEHGHTKKKFGFVIPDDKSVQALLKFNMACDRFGLPMGQAVWGEATQK